MKDKSLYLMLFPYLFGLTFLVLVPALFSFGLIFLNFDLLGSLSWAGLAHLRDLVQDRLVRIAFGNTLFYVIVVTFLRLLFSTSLAMLFYRSSRYHDWIRPFIYLPSIIPDIAYTMIWVIALNPQFGPVNWMLSLIQLPTPAWMVDPWPTRWALVFMAAWQMGEGFVVTLVSLREIPRVLHETAEIDGSGPLARFWYITLPLLLPRLLLLSARDMAVSIQASFIPSLMISRGGLGYSTLFVPLYAYNVAFEDLRFGYAATFIWAFYLQIGILVYFMMRLLRRYQYQGSFDYDKPKEY